MSQDELITIVTPDDKVSGSKTRREMRRDGGIYRVTFILVFNQIGELLVQTRTESKDWCPGYFDLAAGGIVQFDEDYLYSAERELEEELGVMAKLNFSFMNYNEDLSVFPPNQNWGAVYNVVHDGPFSLQAEEVAAAEFMSVENVLKLPRDSITPDTWQVFLSWLMRR